MAAKTELENQSSDKESHYSSTQLSIPPSSVDNNKLTNTSSYIDSNKEDHSESGT
jgi:hypothetical protein